VIRRQVPEEMDRPDVDSRDHVHALRSLNRINGLFGVNRRLGCRVQGLCPCLSVLDLGCGGGGFLAGLTAMPSQRRPALLIGLDRSAFALHCAARWHPHDLRWVAADARHIPLADNSVDVVTSSLFLHHFGATDAVDLLREAARVARRGVVIGDLARSWPAWALTGLVTRVLTRSRLVHVDGPRSVRAAFGAAELADLADQAGLDGASVERQFPFRLILTWTKSKSTVDRC